MFKVGESVQLIGCFRNSSTWCRLCEFRCDTYGKDRSGVVVEVLGNTAVVDFGARKRVSVVDELLRHFENKFQKHKSKLLEVL